MSSLPVTLRALGGTGGLRRVLAAYWFFDFIEFSAWLAIILYCYEKGGAPFQMRAELTRTIAPRVRSQPIITSLRG